MDIINSYIGFLLVFLFLILLVALYIIFYNWLAISLILFILLFFVCVILYNCNKTNTVFSIFPDFLGFINKFNFIGYYFTLPFDYFYDIFQSSLKLFTPIFNSTSSESFLSFFMPLTNFKLFLFLSIFFYIIALCIAPGSLALSSFILYIATVLFIISIIYKICQS